MLSAVRAARVVAVALPVPALVGVLAVGVAGTIAGAAKDENSALIRVTAIAIAAGTLTFASQLAAAVAVRALLRAPPFASSALAEPAGWLGALRPFGGLALLLGAFLPALREPLVGVAGALIDAAFVGALTAAVAPALATHASVVRAIALGYVIVRIASALAVVSADEPSFARGIHRVLGVAAALAVGLVFARLARVLRAAESR